jgi:ABC-type transport system involved in multi-copper enzyme maturation permease subunit
VILNFGLTGVTLSCSMIAIFIGSGLLNKEFERRTVYVALSHPISRAQFLIGKFVGLGLVLFLNWLLMSAAYFLILYQTSSELALFKPTLYIALILTFVNSLLMASVTVFFSSFSTTSLSTIMSIGIYLIGNNITALRNVTTKLPVGIGKTLLKFVTPLLPNLEHFNLGFTVTYGLPVTTESLLLRLLYGVSLSALFLAAAGTTIRTKEI